MLLFLALIGLLASVQAQQGPPVSPEIQLVLATIPTLDPVFLEYETPMAARFTSYYSATWWNCIASFSETFKDALTKLPPTVASPDVSTHNTATRAACIVQSTATLNDLFFGGNEAYLEAMSALNLEPKVNPNVLSCGDDVNCLQSVASNASYSPSIMGHIIAFQTYSYAVKDGFNQLGTDTGCTVSCRAYADTTGYKPVNEIIVKRQKTRKGGAHLAQKRPGRWVPLIESNDRGFFYQQEHVAPHIGKMAKFRFLPESDRTDRVVRPPNYSQTRKREANEVIEQMTKLDDYAKIEIEAFDDKLYTGNAVIASFVGKILSKGLVDADLGQEGYILSLERLIHYVVGFTAAEFDAIIIAWKEKVATDLIRPTSIIKLRGDEEITTWAPGGIQTFAAKDFEAYIRVMPHSEYTSGSSCLFEAIKDYTVDYLAGIGLDTTMPISFPPVAPGASKVEPGLVPSTPILLQYASIEEMAEAGNISRFNGGMHFKDSIEAGVELCSGIGNIVASGMNDLIS